VLIRLAHAARAKNLIEQATELEQVASRHLPASRSCVKPSVQPRGCGP
jgi:hypothetical protein